MFFVTTAIFSNDYILGIMKGILNTPWIKYFIAVTEFLDNAFRTKNYPSRQKLFELNEYETYLTIWCLVSIKGHT